jgi:hypothetical protein
MQPKHTQLRYRNISTLLLCSASQPVRHMSTSMSRFYHLASLLLVTPLSLAWYTANTTLTLAQVVGDPQCASNETAFHALNEIHIDVSERASHASVTRPRDRTGAHDTLTPMLMDVRSKPPRRCGSSSAISRT